MRRHFIKKLTISFCFLEMFYVKHPVRVKELLHKQVEEMKIRRRVRFGEIMTDDMDDGFDDDDSLDDEN